MKKLRVYLFLYSTLFLFSVEAQQPFATLKKNVNSRASSLVHKLNKTKDTLILSSESSISKIYSINRQYKREIDETILANHYKLPLNKLSQGKHVMVVSQNRMKIVFVIWINQDPTEPLYDRKALITSRQKD